MRVHLLLATLAIVLITGCARSAAPAAIIRTSPASPTISSAATLPPTATAVSSLPTATTVPPSPTPPPTATAVPLTFANPRDEALAQTAVAHNASLVHHEPANTGIWEYPPGSFYHPIALAVHDGVIYLLDGGRVLALQAGQPLAVLLAPGDVVVGVPVVEPLDVTAAADGLIVLDRAGDVYRMDWETNNWFVDRYDRPVGESSGHYYVAVAAGGADRYLLEASYQYVRGYRPDGGQRLWLYRDSLPVDIAARDADVYVLTQARSSITGTLTLYRETARIDAFAPPLEWERPLQIMAAETAVTVLDQNSRRAVVLDPMTGAVQAVHQPPPDVSVMGLDENGRLLFAGADHLYFAEQPAMQQRMTVGPTLPAESPHNPAWSAALPPLQMPITGSGLPSRELQMPGAPRHYRLGVHEGIDFYWRPGTAVHAVADGVVIRATLDYMAPTEAEFAAMRATAQQAGVTPAAALDFYRGRQVWIEHANGLVSRYVHLSEIAPGITEGAAVAQGQRVGAVGNSGSPASQTSETTDAHLHLELWQGASYAGQFLRPIETRRLWQQLLLGEGR